jgi:hypothetical protein
MAQNLTIEDVCREITAVFTLEDAEEETGWRPDLTCQSRVGLQRCDRHHLHNGRHAWVGRVRFNRDLGFYYPTTIVRWKR